GLPESLELRGGNLSDQCRDREAAAHALAASLPDLRARLEEAPKLGGREGVAVRRFLVARGGELERCGIERRRLASAGRRRARVASPWVERLAAGQVVEQENGLRLRRRQCEPGPVERRGERAGDGERVLDAALLVARLLAPLAAPGASVSSRSA